MSNNINQLNGAQNFRNESDYDTYKRLSNKAQKGKVPLSDTEKAQLEKLKGKYDTETKFQNAFKPANNANRSIFQKGVSIQDFFK